MDRVELPVLILERIAVAVAPEKLALVNRDPTPDERGVPRSTAVLLEITALGSEQLDLNSVQVQVDGQVVIEDGRLLTEFSGAGSTFNGSTEGAKLRWVALQTFESQAWVEMRMRARTIGGAALDERYKFQIEDCTAPRLIAAQATGARQVRLLFDEPVEVGVIELRALSTPAVTPQVIETHVEGTQVFVGFDVEMSPDVLYEILVPSTTDLVGNLVQSPFGRALFRGWRAARPAARRFDLWGMLPRFNRRADTTGDLRRFISCLQEVVDLLLADIDRFSDVFDIERAPTRFLELILTDLGNPFVFDLSDRGQRRLAAALVEMYRFKGTARGIREAVYFFLGFGVEIVPFADEALVLGESLLDVDWELGPGEAFARYAFNIEVAQQLGEEQETQLRTLVEYLKPAHTHLVEVLQPQSVHFGGVWVLSESRLGTNSALIESDR